MTPCISSWDALVVSHSITNVRVLPPPVSSSSCGIINPSDQNSTTPTGGSVEADGVHQPFAQSLQAMGDLHTDLCDNALNDRTCPPWEQMSQAFQQIGECENEWVRRFHTSTAFSLPIIILNDGDPSRLGVEFLLSHYSIDSGFII